MTFPLSLFCLCMGWGLQISIIEMNLSCSCYDYLCIELSGLDCRDKVRFGFVLHVLRV